MVSIPAGEWLPELDIQVPGKQRRLTVFFRLLLLIPQYIVLMVLSIVTFFVAIIGWFAALFTGRLPEFAATYLTQYIGWCTRVNASESLLVDRYPPFAFVAPDYPVQVELRPGELNRLAVLFRIILAVPALIIESVVTGGWALASFFIWLIVLVMGRMPESLYESTAAVVRYSMRVQAYWLMVSSAYPKRLFGDGSAEVVSPGRTSGTKPLLMNSGARVLMIVFIILGIIYFATGGSSASWTSDDNSTNASVVQHR